MSRLTSISEVEVDNGRALQSSDEAHHLNDDPTSRTPTKNPFGGFHPSALCSNTPAKQKGLLPVHVENQDGEIVRTNQETHARIDNIAKAEISDAMLELDNLIELLLPDEKIKFSPAELFATLSKGRYALYKGEKWADLVIPEEQPTGSEERRTKFFEKIVGKAMSLITETKTMLKEKEKAKVGKKMAKNRKRTQIQKKAKRNRFYTAAFHRIGLRDDDCIRKSDAILSSISFRKNDKRLRFQTWKIVLALLEIKLNKNLASQGKDQLIGQVRLVFKNQPNRRFVIGILLAGEEMTFSVFDRSGNISSKAFNIHEQPERFLRVIVGICFCDRETLGFDDSINLEGDKTNWTARLNGKEYKIKDVVYTEGVIRGRGTACYEVELENGKSALLKDVWVDMSREDKEWDIIKEFRKIKHCDYIPEVVSHEELEFQEEVDTTARLRESFLEKIVTGKGDDRKVTWAWKDDKYKHIELRAHSRILMTPFGRKIEQFRSLEELLRAIKHFALVIGEFAEDKRLHRDVSLRNVMLQEKEGALEALLVDYDYALRSNRQGTNTVGHRTGTVPFMAIEMLDMNCKEIHAYYHDLESLFYVLCWICTVQEGPQEKRRSFFEYEKTQMCEWNDRGNSMGKVGKVKRSVVSTASDFAQEITVHFPDYFKPAIPCIEKLRKLLFSALDSKDSGDPEIFSVAVEIMKSSNAPDAVVNRLREKLPLRLRERAEIINSFIAIIDEGIATLPAEQRQIPWQGLKNLPSVSNIPSVEQIRPLDIEGKASQPPPPEMNQPASVGRSKRKATEAPRMDEAVFGEVAGSSSKRPRMALQQQNNPSGSSIAPRRSERIAKSREQSNSRSDRVPATSSRNA